ncbi:FtsB family cell division protein [Nocardia cyriacigeorgica]|uniref:FtsB family cell division protein n=1 Tax=Nocardia cyriacigeorgica TaxID=135487 RepID=UPI0024546877|nr:septum formation initiator family protein [Nocardia cyriacigeorgica]
MSTIPDPAARFPLPHTDRTVFLAPHITSDRIEVGDYTYFDDPHARAAAPSPPAGGRPDDKAEPRKISARKKKSAGKDTPERTILGLSTGKAVILAMVVCALALTLAVPMRTYFSQRAEAAQLAQERRQLEDDLARLRDRRAQQQDPAYIRSEAKDRLRLVMPGETPYIVQVPGIEAPARPGPTTPSREPDPWYTGLWRSVSEPQPAPDPAPVTTTPPAPAPNPEGPR